KQLRAKYVANGWLETPARGVYRRPATQQGEVRAAAGSEWESAVYSLQTLNEHPVYVGGRTALELQGFGHYVSGWRTNEVQLYTPAPLPKWSSQLDLGVHISVHRRSLFVDELNTLLHEPRKADAGNSPSFMLHRSRDTRWPLRIATAERA